MAFTKPHLLDYYEVENAWDINIVHGVNNRERFESYLNNPSVHMFEVDMEDNGGNIKHTTLKHEGVGDVPFTWAIEKLIKHKKALKLDLKLLNGNPYRSGFYSHVLSILRERWDTEIPVWINADVLRGPNWENSSHEYLDPADSVRLYNSYHKDNTKAMISLGYLTSFGDTPVEPYTAEMLNRMRKVIENIESQITIALRYVNLMKYSEILQEFLELGSVTIWNREDKISVSQFNQLKERVWSLNVFKDLTGKNGKPIWN
jgi:hypothetical protein